MCDQGPLRRGANRDSDAGVQAHLRDAGHSRASLRRRSGPPLISGSQRVQLPRLDAAWASRAIRASGPGHAPNGSGGGRLGCERQVRQS